MSLKDVKKKCEDVFVRALAKIVLQHIHTKFIVNLKHFVLSRTTRPNYTKLGWSSLKILPIDLVPHPRYLPWLMIENL
jgi:hypothetical protein